MAERLRSLQVTYKFTTTKRFDMETLVMTDKETVEEFLERVAKAIVEELP